MIPAAAEPGAAPRDVAVLIPDGRERFALAAAFAPDRLAALVTTLWTPPGRAPWRWLLSDEAARRRWRDDLPPDAVRPFAAPELARLLLARLAPGERARAALLDARNVAFDRHARRALARLDPAPRVVVGHPSCWLATLRWCRARSIRTVVVLPLAHPATVRATGAAMAARHPAWAATWDLAARSPRLERRYEAELAEADLVVVPSDYVAESCRAAGLPADKLRRVPYGADAARFAAARAARAAAAPRPAPRPVRFLTVGYLSQRKGTGTLLEAFARLPRGAATLDLVGAWHGGAAGRAPFAALLGEGVRERGFLRGAGYVAALADADVFVLPSLCEGSALVTYEAMAAGLPLVVTPATGSLLAPGDADGALVAPDDADALADALRAALDPATRARWQAAALARPPRTWDDYRADLRAALA